jgi:hypothetical protein
VDEVQQRFFKFLIVSGAGIRKRGSLRECYVQTDQEILIRRLMRLLVIRRG